MFAYKNLSLKKLGFNQLEVYIVSSVAARFFHALFGSYNTKLGHNPNFLSVVRYFLLIFHLKSPLFLCGCPFSSLPWSKEADSFSLALSPCAQYTCSEDWFFFFLSFFLIDFY